MRVDGYIALELMRRAVAAMLPPRRRTYLEFAEAELVLATGPRRGMRFRSDYMPWTRPVIEEFDRGRYNRFFASGPVQAGKTLIFFILPILYHLFECGESVIVGVPKVDMAQGIWDERILPAIQASRYAHLIPLKGSGSRGGKFIAIRFANGAVLRFMGAGGSAAQQASHTARVVVMTEIDKMDEAGENSRETDPVTGMEARSRSFGSQARVFGECTMSTTYGRIHMEVVEYGTDTKIVVPCAKCGEYVHCDRENFVGWQEATDIMQAQANGRFVCPACRAPWTEEDRKAALRAPVLAARGQVVNRLGVVEGPAPSTNTWGFRWNAMHNALVSMAEISAAEYRAERSGKPEEAKALMQFTWAQPYEEQLTDLSRIDPAMVLQKIVRHQRRVIPEGTIKLTLGVDVGSYVIWWTLVAWSDEAKGHVVDFGSQDVPRKDGAKDPAAVLAALRSFRDDVVTPGWGGRQPDLTLVDSGWESDVVYRFILESGQPRWSACKGFGSSSRFGMFRQQKKDTDVRAGSDGWVVSLQKNGIRLVEVHADKWKAAVHDGFAAAKGAAGSLTLFESAPTDPEMRIYARQIAAERREVDPSPNKELGYRWVVLSKQNHYLDSTSYARCAGDILGIKMLPVPRPPTPARPGGPGGNLKWSRDRY